MTTEPSEIPPGEPELVAGGPARTSSELRRQRPVSRRERVGLSAVTRAIAR